MYLCMLHTFPKLQVCVGPGGSASRTQSTWPLIGPLASIKLFFISANSLNISTYVAHPESILLYLANRTSHFLRYLSPNQDVAFSQQSLLIQEEAFDLNHPNQVEGNKLYSMVSPPHPRKHYLNCPLQPSCIIHKRNQLNIKAENCKWERKSTRLFMVALCKDCNGPGTTFEFPVLRDKFPFCFSVTYSQKHPN